MTAYDFWEPLSLRLSSVSLSLLSGHCEYNHNRARAIENMIHARVVPIGLLREIESSNHEDFSCRSCGHNGDNPHCTDDYHG